MDFEEEFDGDVFGQSAVSSTSEENSFISEPKISAETVKIAVNSVPDTNKVLSPFLGKFTNGYMGGQATNTLFNNNFDPNYAAKIYNDSWNKNFEYILGPSNPAFIDATLSYQDIAAGLHLEYNSNGILWRVNAAGIPTYEDLNNYFEQNRVIEATTNQTIADTHKEFITEVKPENSKATDTEDISGHDNRYLSGEIKEQLGNSLIKISPQEFMQLHPEAITNANKVYNWENIGAQPLSSRTTLMKSPNYFYHNSSDFSQAFDYVTITVGYGNGQTSVTRDCFGRWYISGGIGASLLLSKFTTPVNISVVGGYLQDVDRTNLKSVLQEFIPGKSVNVAVGVAGTIAQTQAGDVKAMEIGFGTPQISISTNWTADIRNIIKEYFTQSNSDDDYPLLIF